MTTMDALSIRYNSWHSTDRVLACAGDSHASSGIDVACPTTQSVLAIASPHELHGDSWPSSSTGTSSFCCNQQYSITAVTTSTGVIAERYAYTAYGQPTILNASGSVLTSSAVGNRYTYTGREWDETLGLHHFRARWMSPLAGRFLGRDPIGYEGSPYVLYEPLDSRPLQECDPTGTTSLARACETVYERLSPCAYFLSIFNEFDPDCQTERDADLLEYIDKYTSPTRGGAYCGCMGSLCPETQIYKEEYANMCCVLTKVRKSEIRTGRPNSSRFKLSFARCITQLVRTGWPRLRVR